MANDGTSRRHFFFGTLLAAAVPAWQETLQALDPAALQSRVGFRCASPDYLPVVGPAPDHAAFLADYARVMKTEPVLVSGDEGQKLLAAIGTVPKPIKDFLIDYSTRMTSK